MLLRTDRGRVRRVQLLRLDSSIAAQPMVVQQLRVQQDIRPGRIPPIVVNAHQITLKLEQVQPPRANPL